MRFLRRKAFLLVLLTGLNLAHGFVMIGPMDPARLTATNAGPAIDLNYWDDLGGPKEKKNFFRWNTPDLTYSFDASFIKYFGLEGRFAINEAFTVLNDFFHNDDYSGVSALDLAKHGFISNYNSSWVNITAQNHQILDIKSLTLGLLINHLGLGNPHRYAYGIHDAQTNQAGTTINFRVRLRNYDPLTYKQTDKINNVRYSYRLIHDGTNTPAIGTTGYIQPSFADMEEFTTDTSGNAWSTLASICDSFYGNSLIYWTDKPSLFDFGVYYDGKNAMGGKISPRHALTYDDAGGLKYLYRTNNFVYENLPTNVVLVIPPQLLPMTAIPVFPGPTGRLWPDSLGGTQGFIPRRNAAIIPGLPTISVLPSQGPPAFFDLAMRGGINKMQFYEQPFDSLLGIIFTATNQVWTDTFITTNGQTVIGLDEENPGAALFLGVPSVKFATQEVGRAIWQPDIIFVADDLGVSPDGVPIGWNRTDASLWMDNFTNTLGPVITFETNVGPGVIVGPIQYTFTKIHEDFEVIWSGEASIVGGTTQYSLWGHIKGPGPNDIVMFPRDVRESIVEQAVSPVVSVPSITMVSEDGGLNPINNATITRTQEMLTLVGTGLASVWTVEIMNGGEVVQTINPATEYIVSDQIIQIPAGIISDTAEGTERTVRLWNPVGVSEPSTGMFTIETGKPFITGTTSDGLIFNRANSLLVQGYGFKSKTAGSEKIAWLRVDEDNGTAVEPRDGNVTAAIIDVVNDRLAEIPMNAISYLSDGPNRRLRLARQAPDDIADIDNYLSPTDNVRLISAITTKPVINSYQSSGMDANGTEFRRDKAMEINGTGLNTTYQIEILQKDGSAFTPSVAIQLPHPGVAVERDGTRIIISAGVFTQSDADADALTETRQFKIYNGVDNTSNNAALTFHVNTLPEVDFIGAFKVNGAFNRDGPQGDDVMIAGRGLKAIGEIHLVKDDGMALDADSPRIELPNAGVTVKDTSIFIDTSAVQFSNGPMADSTDANLHRVFALKGKRGTTTTPAAQRFRVGIPPTFTSLSGITGNNYRRDTDTMEFTGTGLGQITRVEIVDNTGQPIPNVNGIDTTGGVTIVSATSLTIDADATGWRPSTHLMDSVGALSRRIKVTTPFGTATSASDATGAFTISATPEFLTTPQATFAGGGYNGGIGTSGTYYLNEGDLVLNGRNFHGLTNIRFMDNTGAIYFTLNFNPVAPPSGFAFNTDGTKLTIDSSAISTHNGNWAVSDGAVDRKIRLTSVAGHSVDSQLITTAGGTSNTLPLFTSLTGPVDGHFRRDQAADLVVTGVNLGTATLVELVDVNGNAIPGHTGIAADDFAEPLGSGVNGYATVTANTITINGNATWYTMAGDANETDTITALGRRIKITTPSGTVTTTADDEGAFTISATPTPFTDIDVIFASGAYTAGTDTYKVASGDLLINVEGVDPNPNGSDDGSAFPLRGIKQIELLGTADAVLTTLTNGWTVNAAGNMITIPAATAALNGWGDSSTLQDRKVKLTTVANQSETSPAIKTEP